MRQVSLKYVESSRTCSKRKSNILRFLVIDRVLLREYSPADSADYAEEYSRAVLFRRVFRLDYWSYWGSSM